MANGRKMLCVYPRIHFYLVFYVKTMVYQNRFVCNPDRNNYCVQTGLNPCGYDWILPEYFLTKPSSKPIFLSRDWKFENRMLCAVGGGILQLLPCRVGKKSNEFDMRRCIRTPGRLLFWIESINFTHPAPVTTAPT